MFLKVPCLVAAGGQYCCSKVQAHCGPAAVGLNTWNDFEKEADVGDRDHQIISGALADVAICTDSFGWCFT